MDEIKDIWVEVLKIAIIIFSLFMVIVAFKLRSLENEIRELEQQIEEQKKEAIIEPNKDDTTISVWQDILVNGGD